MIVHLGLGAFARSHLAWYLHRLADPAWTVCGVGLMPGDARVRDGLLAQGCDYTLVLRHPDGREEAERVTSVSDYLFAPDDPWAVVDRMADPSTRVVSLTVTEGGYAEHPSQDADLVPGAAPATAFGLVTHALQRRRAAGVAPFTVLSCDNVEGNGEVARAAFARFADRVDPGLGSWLREQVAFPSSMVDRITPATTDDDRRQWDDDAVVVAEPFAQWVVEDRFPQGRPDLERVGVQVVADVRPYELLKLRMLNAAHQALAYPAALLGHVQVHDAAADPLVAALLRAWWAEAAPSLPPVPGVDVPAYTEVLLGRFGNPHVADTVARLCAHSSDRIAGFVLPVLHDNVRAGRPVAVGAVVLAAWAHWLDVAPDRGLDVVDERATPGGPALVDDVDLLGRLSWEPAVREPFQRALALLRDGDLAGGLAVR